MSLDRSLLELLDSPVAVSDVEGRTVWLNPAFERRFGADATALGRPLAEVVEGVAPDGGALAAALVRVAREGGNERLPIRRGGAELTAVVSALVRDGESVGVIALIQEAQEALERLAAAHRELQEPLGLLEGALDSLLEQTGGRRAERYRDLVEDGLRALGRVRKAMDQMASLLSGNEGAEPGHFDPSPMLRRLCERAGERATLLARPGLPPVRCDEGGLESALGHMLARRLGAGAARLVLGARSRGDRLLVSLAELPEGGEAPAADDPALEAGGERAAVEALGGRLHVASHAGLGRVTLVSLPL